jgi:acylphosphatase
VEKMIDFCRSGPPQAEVTKIYVQWKEYSGEFNSFKIHPTVSP